MSARLNDPLLEMGARDSKRSRPELVRAFFRLLESHRIRCALLGNAHVLEVDSTGDIDMVVEQSAIAHLPALVWNFCAAEQIRCIQVVQHEWSAFSFILAWRSTTRGELRFLQLDVCGDYGRSGRLFLSSAELVERCVRDELEPEIFVPAPELSFIAYLLKKVDKRSVTPEQMTWLCARWREAPEASQRQLRRFWNPDCADLIAGAIQSGDCALLHRALSRLRGRLLVRRSLHERIRELIRIARRCRKPAGYWAAFLGPDGSGKSTIAERVGRDLAPLFRSVQIYHLRPHMIGRLRSKEPVTDPHGSPPRGKLASVAKLVLWCADYGVGFLGDIYPRLVRAQLVLFDRHFLDLLVDPRRYRYGSPRWIASMFSALTFSPSLFVLLDAPVHVLHARKQEVGADEVERQRLMYRRLVQRFPQSCTVNVSRPVDEVASEIEDHLLACLARRAAERFGLPHAGSSMLGDNEPSRLGPD